MRLYFASQSDLPPTKGDLFMDVPAVTSTRDWIEHFRANGENLRDIPWGDGVKIEPHELAEIAESLRAWQVGETSEGAHLRIIARRHAEKVGDPDLVEMMDCFIAEEQRHGATLGRFLDLAGVPRASSDWGDSMFRICRHFLLNLETFT